MIELFLVVWFAGFSCPGCSASLDYKTYSSGATLCEDQIGGYKSHSKVFFRLSAGIAPLKVNVVRVLCDKNTDGWSLVEYYERPDGFCTKYGTNYDEGKK